jgi:CubicO group peptidase (beta-lactamase class C family)
LVFGALLDDHVRAVTGRGLRDHFADRFAAPYGLDFHLGLAEDEESRFVPALPSADPAGPGPEPGSLPHYATNGGTDLLAMMKRRSARAHGQLSFGGIGSARGVARMYAAAVCTVDGHPPLLTDGTTTEFSRPYSLGPDLVLGVTDHYALGFEPMRTYLPFAQERSFGHKGATGSLGWCDPDSGIAYGYVRRRFHFPAPENVALSMAVMNAVETDRF